MCHTVGVRKLYKHTREEGGFGAGRRFRDGLFKRLFGFDMVGELDDSSERTGLRLLPSILPLLTLPSYCSITYE